MQKYLALSVTEAELIAATRNDKDMMYAKWLLESMELYVKLPLILQMDKKEAVDLVKNIVWVKGKRWKDKAYVDKTLLLMQAEGARNNKWTPGSGNISDIFTKNLQRKDINKHAAVDVRKDLYVGDS